MVNVTVPYQVFSVTFPRHALVYYSRPDTTFSNTALLHSQIKCTLAVRIHINNPFYFRPMTISRETFAAETSARVFPDKEQTDWENIFLRPKRVLNRGTLSQRISLNRFRGRVIFIFSTGYLRPRRPDSFPRNRLSEI